MNLEQTLRARWSPKWAGRSEITALHGHFDKALIFAQAPAFKRTELRKSGHLSDKGVARELRAHLAKNGVVAELRRSQAAVKAEGEAIKAQRAALARPEVDKTDLRAELQRQEVRSYLRSLPMGERTAALTQTPDPLVFAAVLSAPAALSGVAPALLASVERLYVETACKPQLEALEERQAANELTVVALDSPGPSIEADSGLMPPAFHACWGADGREEAEAA